MSLARQVSEYDPFLQDATTEDFGDPFDLKAEKQFIRRNLLSFEILYCPLFYCDYRSLLCATQVNRTWHEIADSDKVWKVQCKMKWGSEPLIECKTYCKALGWKLSFFVGLCKTLLVNTPDGHAVAVVPYPGLTIRDLLNSLGIEKVHHYRVSCPHFADELAGECEDTEADGEEGCWPSLSRMVLSDVLVEPVATIYIESIRRKDKERRAAMLRSEEDVPSSSEAETKMKLLWKIRALARLENFPRFILSGMHSHWPSLCPPVKRTSCPRPVQEKPVSRRAPTTNSKSVLPSQNRPVSPVKRRDPPSTKSAFTVSHASGPRPAGSRTGYTSAPNK